MNPETRKSLVDVNTVENPNQSVSWDKEAFDRMEGNKQEKNKNSLFSNQKEYIDPTKR